VRVALLIDSLDCGGAEGVVQRLAAGLSRRGHTAFIYSLTDAAGRLPDLDAVGVTVREAHSFGRDLLLPLRLARWLHADRIQLVHAHSATAATYAALPAKLLGLPLVHVRHGRLLAARSLAQRLAERLDVFADRVVVVSESELLGLPPQVARRARHIPNGRDLPRPDPAAARQLLETICRKGLDGPIVLSVGSLAPEKDTLGLLEAFAMLRRKLPQAVLVCAGAPRDPAYWEQVQTAARQLGLQSRVYFPGKVVEAWRLMAAADVFCLASRTEAMPNVIVEAMSQQVPIVATAVGDVGRILRDRHTALLVEPGRPQMLAEALWESLRDRKAARARADRAADEYRRLYTGALMIRRYEQLYAECLGRAAQESVNRTRRPGVLMVGPGPDQIGGIASVISAFLRSPLRHSVNLAHFSTSVSGQAGGNLLCRIQRQVRGLAQLAAAIRRTRARLVHIHTCSFFSYYRSLVDAAVARLLGAKVVLHIHGGQFEQFCAKSGRFGRWFIRLGAALADAVVVLSHRWQHRLRQYFGHARLAVIPNGISVQQTAPAARPPQAFGCRFVYLGAISAAKGLEELIEAAQELRRTGVPFELILAGPESAGLSAELKRKLEAAQTAGLLKVLGPVVGTARDELLAGADCLVLPSHQEALPMVLLEAGAAAIPVIATAVGDIPELLAPQGPAAKQSLCGLLVPARDPAALAQAMRQMACQPELRHQLGARLQQRVRSSYSLAQQAVRCASLYRELTGRRRRRLRERLCGMAIFPLHERLRGRATLRELRQLVELAALPPDQLRSVVAGRLKELLRFAGTHLPYYGEQFARYGVDPDGEDPFGELSRLPVLEKADVRANAPRMIWQAVPGGLIPSVSGGTSGDTLHFFIDRVRAAQSMAARLFMQMQFGVMPGDLRFWLWGSPIELKRSRLRAWRDRLINEVVLDAFDMSPQTAQAYLQRIAAARPRVLIGYTSAVARLARQALGSARRQDFEGLALVVVTGDEVHPEHREIIAKAFGCPVASEYGSREVGLIAHECPHGRMHVIAPHILVEVVQRGRSVREKPGRIVCTNLNTRAQPLIRYALGDVGRLVDGVCECGLPFPLMEITAGRITGFLALPDGRLRDGHLVAYVIRSDPGVADFRVYQRAVDRLEVLITVNERFTPATVEGIRTRLGQYLGPQVRVDCRVVSSLPPDPSGKRRHLVSEVAAGYLDFELEALPSESHSVNTSSLFCCLTR
jgi:phenylacetate-CoA ligase